MNRGLVIRCSLGAALTAACGGELDDPAAYDMLTPNTAIRPANSYPLAVPNAPVPAPATGGAPSGQSCDRALQIFASPSCASTACHGTAGSTEMTVTPQVDLNFDQANLATRLTTTMGSGECNMLRVIDTQNPAQSLLVAKLTDPPPCGLSMPYPGFPALAEADKQCIIDWVYAAATVAP